MKIRVAWIGKTKEPAIQTLTEEYLKRIGHYAQVEGIPLKDEAALRKLCGSERISQLARSEGSAEAPVQGEGAVPAPPVPTRPA